MNAQNASDTKYIGGTARLNISGLPKGSGTASTGLQQLTLNPYFLTPGGRDDVQRVKGFSLSLQNNFTNSDNDSRNTVRVVLAATFGQRRQLAQWKQFFLAGEYAGGPSVGFANTKTDTRFESVRASTYELGAFAYADIVLGWRASDRLSIVTDLVNASARMALAFGDDLDSVQYSLTSNVRQGFYVGVEWRLKAKD